MKEVVDILNKSSLIYKNMSLLDNKELKIRSKIEIYSCVDTKSFNVLVLVIKAKSRFVRKDIEKIDMLLQKVQAHLDLVFKKRVLIIASPLCSKAKSELIGANYKVIQHSIAQ